MDSDSDLELSPETLRALQQVMQEQQDQQERFEKLRQQAEERFDQAQENDTESKELPAVTMDFFREDWQLSQFWYDDATSEKLAREILDQTDANSVVCCISSPTAYVKLMSMNPPNTNNLFLFEYDTRFDVYGRQFIHYDYSKPLEFRLSEELKGSIDMIVVDPPFLSEECLTKTLETVRLLLKKGGKVVLCTGAVMLPIAKQDGLELTTFLPGHQNGLSNDFRCYVNYKSEQFPLKEQEGSEQP
ncbi:putative N6-adenine methyltransferase-domain-containing protein [Gamsiella multidivaricata]|uniref:putative N6-adenine methyltransferase-domain-containing protein n=1 Tax=Gamsiella multidivaricata TaxID=101098 RepID=UPI00222053E4|nr:putative N6-adenine methyltransferase-domain-containing protein [Gamsiella multidivaricata]KAG0368499.1 EEF1A lysine methyltransferase 1 [Gamsiella multidivaricata]KAI7819515.1 putative N6-adenine methyltransferase-domain-containing protein [Gamsiella multidivaricata]